MESFWTFRGPLFLKQIIGRQCHGIVLLFLNTVPSLHLKKPLCIWDKLYQSCLLVKPDYYKNIPWKPSSASLLSFVRWLAFMHNWRVTAWKEWQKSLDSFGLAEAHSFSNTESKWVQILSEGSFFLCCLFDWGFRLLHSYMEVRGVITNAPKASWKEWQNSLDSFGLAEAHNFSNIESKWVQIPSQCGFFLFVCFLFEWTPSAEDKWASPLGFIFWLHERMAIKSWFVWLSWSTQL